jgi:hypothetical protein
MTPCIYNTQIHWYIPIARMYICIEKCRIVENISFGLYKYHVPFHPMINMSKGLTICLTNFLIEFVAYYDIMDDKNI